MGLFGIPRAYSDRLAFVETNLAVNTLRDQIDAGWSVLKMVDGVADEFEDATGIGSSDGTYDATGDYIHNAGGYTTNLVPTMTGYTSPTGAVSTDNDVSGAAWKAFDKANGNGNVWQSNDAVTSAYLRYQFASISYPIAKYTVKNGWQFANRAPKTWTIRGSNDGSSWTTLDTRSSETGWATGESRVYTFTNSTVYTYIEMNVTAVDGGNAICIDEVDYNGVITPSNITVVSTAATAVAGSTDAGEVRMVLLHQPVESVTLNTDVTIEVSRDGGTTWTAGTLVSEGAFDATTNILTAIIDVSGQPAGTSMKWRFKTFNAKEQRIHGVWMQWR